MVYAFGVETRVLAFTFLVTLASGTLLGVLPAVQAYREGEAATRSLGARSTAGRARQRRLQGLLIVTEVALSVALLVGAGLFARSFGTLVTVDPGFEPDGLLYLDLELSAERYTSGQERRAFFAALEERLAALPGVTAVTTARGMPPRSGFSFGVTLQAEGGEAPLGDQPLLLPSAEIGPDYLDVLGIGLLAGRTIGPADRDADNVLVDESLARFLFGEGDPLGRRFRLEEDDDWLTVVGVVEELRLMGADDRQGGQDLLYALPDTTMYAYGDVAIRASGDPRELMALVRRAVVELDPEQPIGQLQTATDALGDSLQTPRFLATVMLALAGVAALLAALGIHGLLAYTVSRRTREMGIRMALGAPAERLRARIVATGVALAAVGVALGLGLASVLDHLIQSLLFGVVPEDLATRLGVGALMLLVAAASCWVPARRATRVNPVEVLNAE
jgi:predicted permease